MHDIFSREPDPLDGMLAPPSPSDTDALRQTVYARTRRVLRRGRRLRQFAYFAVMLHAFLGGMGTMYAVLRPAAAPDEPARSASKEASQPPAPDVPAIAREWQAFDSDNRRAELYRRAGQTYLKEELDPLSAVRCYGNSLDSGTERDRAISTDDDYLLMAIKIARQKEKNDAKNDG
jgi:hypothetical protein